MRVNNTSPPDPAAWVVLALSLVGAFTVAKWIIGAMPESLTEAVAAFNTWMTTGWIAPIDIAGVLLVLLMILLLLTYPMVMRA